MNSNWDQRSQRVGTQFNADSIHVGKDEDHRLLGLSAWQTGSYADAVTHLRKAVAEAGTDSELRFYLALSLLAGRRPRVVDGDLIRQVEGHLEAAVQVPEGCPQAAALWAVVREDHYLGQGRPCPDPSPAELMAGTSNVSLDRIAEIITAVSAPEARSWRELLGRLGVPVLDAETPTRSATGPKTERARLLRKYFIPDPEPIDAAKDETLMIVGAAAAVIGLIILVAASGGGAFFGFLVLVAGAIVGSKAGMRYQAERRRFQERFDKSRPKPSDRQVRNWLDEDRSYVAQIAYQRLNLTGAHLICRLVPVFGPDLEDAEIRITKDGEIYFSRYRVVLVAMTESHISACVCTWDFITGDILEDATREFYYRDIVSLATSTDHRVTNRQRHSQDKLKQSYEITQARTFRLEVANGTAIEVVTNVSLTVGESGDADSLNTQTDTAQEDAIRAIHAQLRLKKDAER